MNREEAKRLLPIIQAFAGGKEVQRRHVDNVWLTAQCPQFDLYPAHDFRIKLRPWKPEEAPKIFVVTGKGQPGLELRVVRNGKWVDTGGKYKVAWGMLLDQWLRIAEDGSEFPCGVMENAP